MHLQAELLLQRDQILPCSLEALKDAALLCISNGAVKFWTRDDWNEWNNKQPRSKGQDRRVSNAVPRHYYYLEDEHGEVISIVVYNNILKYMRETFADTNHYMPALLGTSWSRVDKVFQEAIKNEMSTHFPLFTLCQGSWKVHDILSRWYSHWRGKPSAKLKKSKKGSEVDGGDNGEDSEGQETHGRGPSPDDAVATASTYPGASNISADTSASKKRPHHESEAPAPVKKPKVIKNPITSKQKSIAITPAPVSLAQATPPGTNNPQGLANDSAPLANDMASAPTPASPTSDAPPTANDTQEVDASPAPLSPTSGAHLSPAPAPRSPANDTPGVNVTSPTSDTALANDAPGANASATGNTPPADNTPGADPDPAADPFTLDVPFQGLKTLAAVALQSSSASNIGLGHDKELPEGPGEKTTKVGTKARKGKKLTVPENSMTARTHICTRNWLQSNPGGLTETYKDYWNSLSAETKAVSVFLS
ncbi:hypothetical protein F5887DRAFT_1076052 [Amanita rubescens]|nr:hypothetical protein F5887DRAFT_1076052 [Amanita rubescens]